MLVQDLIALIDLEADELLDEDTDNIPYINAAIDYLSFILAGLGSSDCLKALIVTPNMAVPSDFIEFVPKNGYPAYISGDSFVTTNGGNVNIKYSASKPHVSSLSDPILFKDMYTSVMVFICSYMIKKKSYIPVEYTQQDSSFVQAVLAAISKAKGGS